MLRKQNNKRHLWLLLTSIAIPANGLADPLPDHSQPAQFHASANGRFEQCEGLTAANDPATLSVINQYLPAGAEVLCSARKKIEGTENSSLVYVVYGEPKGCEQNCYASSMCAINDNGLNYFYSANWYDHMQPQEINLECPSLDGALNGDTNIYCEQPTSGYRKSAGHDTAFWHLRNPSSRNPFRYCFM